MNIVPISYDAANNYFVLSGSLTQVWSSARLSYVAVADATYQAWLAGGLSPTVINTGTAATDQHIVNSAMEEQVLSGVFGNGVNFHSTSQQSWAPGVVPFALDPGSLGSLSDYAASLGLAHMPASGGPTVGGPASFSVSDINGVMRTFSSAQFGQFYSGAIDFVTTYAQAVAVNIGGGSTPLPVNPVDLDAYITPLVTSGSITLGSGASYVQCAPTAPITINAPPSPTNGQLLTIADVGGSASVINYIQFTGNIDGSTNSKLTYPYGWWTLKYYAAGTLWKQV